ncbi:MAG TPA: helix-turn-helix transcriptional regulator [Chloroflexota bacterium]|nr:helix-turn-helix transcriptional regulator [Chloroflexota bacterium]
MRHDTQPARLLRWARRHARLSQEDLAARTSIAQSTITRIETGAVDPHFAVLRTLLRGCGYDLELAPVLGYGVDRSELQLNLARTPAERVVAAAAMGESLRAWHGIARKQKHERVEQDRPTDGEDS